MEGEIRKVKTRKEKNGLGRWKGGNSDWETVG